MRLRRLVFVAGLAVLLAACAKQAPGAKGTTAPGVGTQPNPPGPTQPPPTAVPTVAPETLTTDQIAQRLNPFAAPDCQLPCYVGLTPGDTTLNDALAFYARLGIGINDIVPGDYPRALSGKGNLRATLMRATNISQALDAGYQAPETNVYLSDGKVQNIYVRFNSYPADIAAGQVISALGPPDKIALALIFTTDPNTPTSFVIQMVYTAKQAGFSYLGSLTGDASAQQACLTDAGVHQAVLGVFAPAMAPFSDNPPTPRMLPLDTSTGITPADFNTAVTSTGCISIPSDKWIQWRP